MHTNCILPVSQILSLVIYYVHHVHHTHLQQWIQELDQQLHQEQVDDQKKPTVAMTIWKYVKKVLEFILEWDCLNKHRLYAYCLIFVHVLSQWCFFLLSVLPQSEAFYKTIELLSFIINEDFYYTGVKFLDFNLLARPDNTKGMYVGAHRLKVWSV